MIAPGMRKNLEHHIKEDGLSVTEFSVEMIFNKCCPDYKFTVLTP
jgi:hypothetical protein